jgi:hypothetical protein
MSSVQKAYNGNFCPRYSCEKELTLGSTTRRRCGRKQGRRGVTVRNFIQQIMRLTFEFSASTLCPESECELYRPINRRLSAKSVPTFAGRGYHVVSVTDPYGRIFGVLDRSLYFFFQVAPQLYARG